MFTVHFDGLIMDSVSQFLCKKLVLLVVSLVSFSFSVFRSFISTYLCRLQGNGGSLKSDFDYSESISEETNQKESEGIRSSSKLEPQPEPKTEQPIDFTDLENDKEEQKLEFSFRFRFPTFEEFNRRKKENNDLVNSELVPSTIVSRCEFMSAKSYSGFIEEPEVLHFDVKQTNANSSCDISVEEENVVDDKICSDRIVKQVPPEAVEVLNDEDTVQTEATRSIEEMGGPVKGEHSFLVDQDFTNELLFQSQKESVGSDWDLESISIEHANSVMSPSIDSFSDGFLSEYSSGEFDFDAFMDINGEKAEYSSGEMSDLEKNGESEGVDEEDSDILEELSKLEEDHGNDPDGLRSQFLSDQDYHEDLNKAENDQCNGKDDKAMDGSHDSEKVASKDSSDFEDSNKLETLWEHQELLEQLKMELRKVRATGLPTILEESESPKITEDLKPWKIDEKFQHEECMDELHKFYKSYRERMRKFDIFNYQKMYAIGFLQLKDPLRSISSQKTSGPALKSLLSQNFWHLKHKIGDSGPMVKFMKELQSDLEVVYVGQMCLSWEFLHWQYGKALDLWDSDPRLIHEYNEVAGEFQHFLVLMQRFIEDEPFQGPRVQYYTKSRCLNRYLLQVPVIREDKKDRRRGRKGERTQHAITSDKLVEMMEESIRILWRFIRADKDSSSIMVKHHKAKPTQLQNPGDLELLTEVRKILLKKERKLKDALRSGNCILKRFRKCREDESDQVLYFFSQVDMKLVCRVLNMSKITTEQLQWCHSKLSKIDFEHRKIQVEPSFLLFPC